MPWTVLGVPRKHIFITTHRSVERCQYHPHHDYDDDYHKHYKRKAYNKTYESPGMKSQQQAAAFYGEAIAKE